MSQYIFDDINPVTTSGNDLAALLNSFKDAIASGFSGTSRPVNLQAGGLWVDTTNDPATWALRLYDGTDDITLVTIDLVTNAPSITSATNSFTITRVADDTVGALLELVKRRIAASGQVLSGDIIGHIRVKSRDNSGGDPVVCNIKIAATENHLSSAAGVALAFEMTPAGSATAVEILRVINGRFGIGTTAPDTNLHVMGALGIKAGYAADDANAAKLTTEKERLTGTKATQSGDAIGQWDINTTDDASAKATSAQIQATALENHTASARGTKVTISTATTGAAAKTSKLEIGDIVEPKVRLKINSAELGTQNVATAATISQLTASTALVEMTGATPTDIQGINSGTTLTKIITIHNRSTANVTLKHQSGSAAANDRLKLPGSYDVIIIPEGSATFIYCATDSKWKIMSGQGLSSALDMMNPMTTGGDTIYGGASGFPTRLANGPKDTALVSSGGTSAPAWRDKWSFEEKRAMWLLKNQGTATLQNLGFPAAPSAAGASSSVELSTLGNFFTSTTAATSNDVAGIISSAFTYFRGGWKPELTAHIYFDQLSNGSYQVLVGFQTASHGTSNYLITDGTSTPAIGFTGFGIVHTGGGGGTYKYNWVCITSNGSAGAGNYTKTATGNTAYSPVLRVKYVTSSQVEFYIDGVLVATHTTTIMNPTTTFGYGVRINTLNNVAKDILLSRLEVRHI